LRSARLTIDTRKEGAVQRIKTNSGVSLRIECNSVNAKSQCSRRDMCRKTTMRGLTRQLMRLGSELSILNIEAAPNYQEKLLCKVLLSLEWIEVGKIN